jgi:VIT family
VRNKEQHSTAGEMVRDIVIVISDGLTVPFALAAGLSAVVRSSHVVITAGLAEIAAGSIAMGLGRFPALRGDADYDGDAELDLRLKHNSKRPINLVAVCAHRNLLCTEGVSISRQFENGQHIERLRFRR